MVGPIVRVLLPRDCLACPGGTLIGTADVDNLVCCVTALSVDRRPPVAGAVGFWENGRSTAVGGECNSRLAGGGERNGVRASESATVHLSVTREGTVTCRLCGVWTSRVATEDSVVIVLYDARRFFTSCPLMADRDPSTLIHPATTTVDVVAFSLRDFSERRRSRSWPNTTIVDFVHSEKSYLNVLLDAVLMRVICLLSVLSKIISRVMNLRFFQCMKRLNYPVRRINYVPAVATQMANKMSVVHDLLTSSQHGSPLYHFRCRVVLWNHLLDVLLGITVMLLVLRGDASKQLADFLMAWADNIVCELQRLLRWMMGVPAGLKLNRQLALFLGRFFLYHIYLWTGYLQLLRPVLSLSAISLAGCLGASLQLCLMQDLLSMLTLHIYCFYVYAARLYDLQVCALASLWRLFRGKKWNVLRRRVDSTSYDVDQLFLGTLLFSILLFLVPTTALFYVVFLALRLVVLGMHGLLCKLVSLLNHFPAYVLFLRIFYPDSISDSVEIVIMPQTKGKPLCLHMKLVPMSIARIFQTDGDGGANYTWSTFISHLLSGKLVYPWIDPSSSQSGN